MTVIDIIAAVRNEEQSLPVFLDRVHELEIPEGVELHVVLVEDSSTDGTLDLLRALSAEDPNVGYYSLEQGFGQGPAIIFGLARSRADAAILMDVDGSHPPEVIPEMIERFLTGAGVVQCLRRSLASRRTYRRVATVLFRNLASWLARFDLAEQAIYYRLVSRSVGEILVSDPRYWRFLRFPLPREPGQLVTIEVDTVERTRDESKYGPIRLLRLGIDAVLSLIPRRRLEVGVGLAGLAAIACVGVGAWPWAIPIVAAILWTASRYRALQSTQLIGLMKTRDSANVP